MAQINVVTFEFEENTRGEPGTVLELPGGSEAVIQPGLMSELMEQYLAEYGENNDD